jgi:hypothetical protein
MSLIRAKRWCALIATGCVAGLALPAVAGAAVPRLITTAMAVRTPTGQMVVSCSAVATEPTSSVAITKCYTTNGGWASDISLPGWTAVTTNEMTAPPGPFQVCVEATARLLLGGQEITAPLHCQEPILDLGPGSDK